MVLEDWYEQRFIYHSYATRKGKGTHKAIQTAQRYAKQNKYFLKMDIQKYFASIDHQILMNTLELKIKDKYILDLCSKIILKGGDNNCGLPIGNLTSQFFANVYLDLLDHFLKDKLKAKYYLRYMDDFCVFSNIKEELLAFKLQIVNFLDKELKLTPKKSATMLNYTQQGLPFLGVRIYPNLIRYKKENFNRSFNKLKKREYEYSHNLISYDTYISSMQSLISVLTHYGNNLLNSKLYRDRL